MPWSSGATLTAAQLNTYAPQDWTTYTPTWSATTTPPTIGNGSITGRYIQFGKRTDYWIQILFGSTTTAGSGAYTFTAPVAARVAIYQPAGTAVMTDTSVPATRANLVVFNNSATVLVVQDTAGALVTSVAPYTWATSDRIVLSGTYEAA